jgi:hypothetical protein
MAQVWLKSSIDGTHKGDRLLMSWLSDADALALAKNLHEEFADMGLAITVFVED